MGGTDRPRSRPFPSAFGRMDWCTISLLSSVPRFARIAFDYQVTLFLVEGPGDAERVSAILQIEAPIRVEHGGEVAECDPNDKATHGAMTRVLHLVVSDASLDGDDTSV